MTKIDPEVDWANTKQWETVYAPSSDTFFLCDGVKALADRIKDGSIILEVGSGSGYVTAYTSRFMKSIGKHSLHFTTDINMDCCRKTAEICQNNDVIVAPMCDIFATSFKGKIDVIMFNPPYVETPNDELEDAQKERGIAASYAGGEDGAVVIYDFLNFILNNRDKFADDFLVILLILQVNRPLKLRRFCKRNGLNCETILDRNCQEEHLKILAISPEQTDSNC